MSEKVTIQDIIELLAEKHSMTKKDAEIFVKGMFELIEEALATEKYVKVKGLGTFKLTEVESRESVNVNTGERIEIQGHTKISFTPDSSMKDLINKPFAHFETVILNENTKLEDTETEIEGEEEDTVDENAPKPKQTVAAKEVELIETENTEDSPNENAIAAEDTTPVIEETIIEEPVPSVEITEEKIQIIEPEKESEDIVTEAEKDIVAETAVPQTVSPLAETIEGNKVTDKPELLYGIRQITTDAQALSYDKAGKLVTKDVELTLIPYYAWAHRGEGDMEVWLPIDVSATSAQPQKAGQWEDNGFFKN